MYYQKMMKAYGKEHLKIVLAQLDVRDYHERLVRQQQEKSEELRQVEALLAEVAKSKKFNKKRNVLLDELRQLEKKLAEAKQLEAESEDGVLTLAGAMFLLYGNEILYLSSGAYDQYMHLNAAYAIQWQMIRTALAQGYAFYNFYGISGYFEKGQEGYGVFDFKRGFQAEVVELPGDFIAAVHPLLYKGYTLLQKLKGEMKRG